jgi:hypothetical protein
MTTITIIGSKKTTRKKKKGNEAEGEDDEDYTPWSNAEKDETFHNADEIKTFGNEAPNPHWQTEGFAKPYQHHHSTRV